MSPLFGRMAKREPDAGLSAPLRPLRIAMMLESDEPGGAEMMVFRLSDELRSRGHTVVPVGPANGVGWLGDLFRRNQFTPEVFRLNRAVDPGGVKCLLDLFARHRIDLVHSHEFTMAVYGAAAARIAGLPHLITMHGGLTACKALRRRVALRWAMRNSAYNVMVSRATQKQFSDELDVLPGLFTVVPNGVPVQKGDPSRVREEFGISPCEQVILAVGVLEVHKGHRFLLEALAQLVGGELPPWKLIIACGAGGSEHESMAAFIAAAGMQDRVKFAFNRNDVGDLLELADVFVMPSLWEGLPLAVLEAMVARKPIIASRIAGIPEAVVHDTEGVLVPPGEVGPLVTSLRSLLTDPDRRATLGAAARARAERDFTIEVMTDRYEALYAPAFAASRRSRSFPMSA